MFQEKAPFGSILRERTERCLTELHLKADDTGVIGVFFRHLAIHSYWWKKLMDNSRHKLLCSFIDKQKRRLVNVKLQLLICVTVTSDLVLVDKTWSAWGVSGRTRPSQRGTLKTLIFSKHPDHCCCQQKKDGVDDHCRQVGKSSTARGQSLLF